MYCSSLVFSRSSRPWSDTLMLWERFRLFFIVILTWHSENQTIFQCYCSFSIDHLKKRRTSGEKLLPPLHHSQNKFTSSSSRFSSFFILIERHWLFLFIIPAQWNWCTLLCGRAVAETLIVFSNLDVRPRCPAANFRLRHAFTRRVLQDWACWTSPHRPTRIATSLGWRLQHHRGGLLNCW